MKKIEQVRSLIEATKGKIFTVSFVKKNGEMREMNCRTGVTKYLRGGVNTCANYQEYVTVYDLKVQQYRNINTATLRNFKCGDVNINFS